ncbi:MAG: TetR/AcrR family transcriptional regulator [Paracoccaceae bacterium]
MARLTKDDWLALGLTALAEVGAEALTIEGLTARAQKTRGSFYHHFDDREAFVVGVLEVWRRQTERLLSSPDATLGDLDLNLERAVRRVKGAGPIVAAVDAARLARLREAQADPESPAAADYAQIAYSVFLGVVAAPAIDAPRARALMRLTREMIAAHWNE